MIDPSPEVGTFIAATLNASFNLLTLYLIRRVVREIAALREAEQKRNGSRDDK